MPSDKTPIIEAIFRSRFDPNSGNLKSSIVTLDEVSRAIQSFNKRATGRRMSTKNPANFFKDFIRNRTTANANWPDFVLRCGYTGRQVTGDGLCFEFVPLGEGATEAFPEADYAAPSATTPVHHIESVSLPLASRRLGRNDEPWLIQVIARLRIVETHFSIYSRRKVKQVDLLQMSVKLSRTEIDALYLMIEEDEQGAQREVIVTCEAKRGRDDILEDQVLQQAKAPFRMRQVDQNLVVPVAIKCLGPSRLFLVEFNEVDRATYDTAETLIIAADSIYEIHPSVPGICE